MYLRQRLLTLESELEKANKHLRVTNDDLLAHGDRADVLRTEMVDVIERMEQRCKAAEDKQLESEAKTSYYL